MTDTYADHLARYMAGRRWFSGKGRAFSVSHVHALPWLSQDPPVRTEIVTVAFDDGTHDTYQFPVAYLADTGDNLEHALVGNCEHPELGPVVAYDAVYVREATAELLAAFPSASGNREWQFHTLPGAELPEAGTTATVMTAEQSNTSIVYGDQAILKLFRRISGGGNPDIEVHAALTKHQVPHIAPLLGWISAGWQDWQGTTHQGDLGMLQQFLRTATDGWDLAVGSVRDLLVEEDLHPGEVGGDFAAESNRLGATTAAIHRALADVFGTTAPTHEELNQISTGMQARLDHAITVVPELEGYRSGLRDRFTAVAELSSSPDLQRVHGDLHLGQVLRTVSGWKLIDFEGEPAKPLAERSGFSSPLRDVSGMLRSYDYAAGATLHQFGEASHLGYRAEEWSARNRNAFLAGYSGELGSDVTRHGVLLRAYEADKAVYEAVYEARNRPAWLPIPLQAVGRLAGKE